jgi:hemoglobin
MTEDQLFSRIGEEGFTRIVAGFYRQVYKDDILGPMYPQNDREGSEQRLRDFLIYRFGGSPRYMEQRGHPRLRMRHVPFHINQAARDRWMQLMGKAITDAAIPSDAEQFLRDFLEKMSTFMINQGAGHEFQFAP